jgi:two-component system chemotaxis sensor kinase CheA
MLRLLFADRQKVDDLTKDFLLESGECLDRMERVLNEVQRGKDAPDLIGEIFRAVHTIKGATGFLGLARLEKLAHAGEHLLGLIRDGKRALNPSVVAGLWMLLDGLRRILLLIEKTGGEGTRPSDNDEELVAELERLVTGVPALQATEAVTDGKPGQAQSSTPESFRAGAIHGPSAAESTLRVEVETLNRLMNLVGELVQTRNQILQSEHAGDSFTRMGQRLDAVTADLRETVMQARLQPVGQLFQRFPRMVRELEQSCGKRVRLEMSGAETGLDKSLLEALKDPLAHAIRNAIDHGIETPAGRANANKALEGVVRLSAMQESGFVVVEVIDDGAGIDVERVKERALERGLISAEKAQAISDAEVMELVFEPGFSTCDAVTLISGRGVGMDVVRANVERAGGSVELRSVAGEGTCLRIRVPLTLAIVPALIARCGGQTFVLPQSALVEMLIIHKREETELVEYVGEARMMRLRERLLPLLSLSEMLAIPTNSANGFYVAVLESKGQRFGLMVDELAEQQEIVVKPLSPLLRGLEYYSGASVLSDGTLGLILDVAGIARHGGLGEAAEQKDLRAVEEQPGAMKTTSAQSMLLYEDWCGERRALPMEFLERIESVQQDALEVCEGRTLLQYRGGVVEIEGAGELFVERDSERKDRLVLICKRGDGRRVGVAARQVLDIAEREPVEETLNFAERLARVGARLFLVADGFESAKAMKEAA